MTDVLISLIDLLRTRRTLVLTGAGMSTESGVPDYRSPESVQRRRGRSPIRYDEFTRSSDARRMYWARSALGWPRMAAVAPNAGHTALAALERSGCITGVITQNVDGLHQSAGSRNVLELHGTLAQVYCLHCDRRECRHRLQRRLMEMNPGWINDSAEIEPDGDAGLDGASLNGFSVPECTACGGTIKPDVIFFGENVPRPRVDTAFEMLSEADGLLILGSSLAVYSGYRFALRAKKAGLPVGIINLGETRADHLAAVKVEQRLGHVLPAISGMLC